MKKEQDKSFKELISTISQCFEKLGNESLTNLLTPYLKGEEGEEELSESLKEYLLETFPLEDELVQKTYWIKIPSQNGSQFKISLINSISLEEKYSYKTKELEYLLIINKSDSSNTPYQNTTFYFPSKFKRDNELKILNDKIAIFGHRMIKI